jgi:FkbM family methyltransferase
VDRQKYSKNAMTIKHAWNIRAIIGLFRYWPRSTVAAFIKLPLSQLGGFLSAYQNAPAGAGVGLSQIYLRGNSTPYIIRHGTSDFAVFCQVILECEYRCVPSLNDVRTIVDAGANVGFSARYLLRRFPHACVIAIEPDSGNIDIANLNLSHLRDRCTLVHGAVWSKSGRVAISRNNFRDGREWSIRVCETSGDERNTVIAWTIADLMNHFSIDKIDILKIDIEGAETDLFSSDTTFMTKVKCCAIELHDHVAGRLFDETCRRFGFNWTVHRETTVALTTPCARSPDGT